MLVFSHVFVCGYVHMSAGVSGGQKRVWDPPELESQVVLSHQIWMLGVHLWSLKSSTQSLSHLSILSCFLEGQLHQEFTYDSRITHMFCPLNLTLRCLPVSSASVEKPRTNSLCCSFR